MSVLSREQIRLLLGADPPLATGLPDSDEQVQPCGLDCTLRAVYRMSGMGRLGIRDRTIPPRVQMPFAADGWRHLDPGAYILTINEIVRMPLGLMTLARPRSSLLRCGAILHTAVGDPGYVGRSEVLLVVINPAGIDMERNARFMQLVFFTLDQPTKVGYDGYYQEEG
ncbi:MAG: deoxyuridine 5'-triphosphate nucleotidohydrolase [Chloroflexota bacterium]